MGTDILISIYKQLSNTDNIDKINNNPQMNGIVAKPITKKSLNNATGICDIFDDFRFRVFPDVYGGFLFTNKPNTYGAMFVCNINDDKCHYVGIYGDDKIEKNIIFNIDDVRSILLTEFIPFVNKIPMI